MRRILPPFLVLLIGVTACASSGATPKPPASLPASPAESDSGSGGPDGSEAVLVVSHAGGMLPAHMQATSMPAFVLLEDGRVIMQGMQTLEFPGPALPPMIERTLTPDGVQSVLSAIEETNLFTNDLDLRGAQGVIADGSDTIFTLSLGDRVVRVSVYALGALGMPDMEPPPGVSSDEITAHRQLSVLNDSLISLESWLPADSFESEGWMPYEPSAFRLYVTDVTDQPVDGDPAQVVRPWPTDDDPAAFGAELPEFGDGTRCGVVEGEAGATWLAELSAATQMTQWTDEDEHRFRVQARPVLPHEEAACPD